MSELGSLESLQALHADLLALAESPLDLTNVERLWVQLQAHIQDFRALLDKKSRNDQSRKRVAEGQLEVEDAYEVNEVFKQTALQLADELDLDELDATRICLASQSESETSGRSLLECSIIRFHQRRKYLLDCLRLLLQLSTEVDLNEELQQEFQGLIAHVVQAQDALNDSTKYVRRCLTSMTDIKIWLQKLADKLNSTYVLGQGQPSDPEERTEYQRVSLVAQHEQLSIIVLHLVKQSYSSVADFELVLSTLRKADRFDNLLLHYFPAISGYISRFGGQEGGGSITDARALNERLLKQDDQNPWTLTYVHAAIRAWWLAEYSGWYGENHDGTLPQNQLEEESKQRSKQFTEALKDGAFDFILSMSADVKSADWHDPARHGLRQWLQRKAPPLLPDSTAFSDFFHEGLMEQLQSFIEAFITNMPDVLRKLRVDEDEQRQLSSTHDHDLDLERFIVTISYAFEGRPKAAAEAFWDVKDGALMGFMHWASRRASTPLVSAFCEMLQAISEDEECATNAHEFLLDEGPQSSGKMRRTHSLTWNQIFKELNFFSAKIRDRPAVPQTYGPGKPNSDHAEMEPESFLMLECYLRLITRLCMESAVTRQFLTQHPSFHLIELLFQLASSSIQPRLKACAFTTLRSLLSHKTKEAGDYLWTVLESWISGGHSPGSTMPKSSTSSPATSSATHILQALATGFEEPHAFVQLLHALVVPYEEEIGISDGLPFPESLGSTSRMPGIEPYVDLALWNVFALQTSELHDIVQVRLLRLSCLEFIATCLGTFNEDLVIFANRSNVMVDAAIHTSNLQAYVLLHPFSRVMEWMYTEKVMDALFASIHQDVTEVGRSSPDSPLILCLLRGIQVVSLIMELQATYMDIIRPLIKLQSTHRRTPVSIAKFASFEDGILKNLSIISDLGLYCGSGHPNLVIASLGLLEMLSASPKLVTAPSTVLGRRGQGNKAIAILEADNNADTISKLLLHEMEPSVHMNEGPESSAHAIKTRILDFLIACLQASPNEPTIAHLLLGFECRNNTLNKKIDSSFDRGISLFHALLEMVLDIPVAEGLNVLPWLVSFKLKGLHLLRLLWQSPLSSDIVMTEMREKNALFLMFDNQLPVVVETRFDGLEREDPRFLSSKAASCLSEFLSQRAIILQYVSAELRQVAHIHSPSLKRRILSTLLGSTTWAGQERGNASILDLFDFMELEFSKPKKPSVLSSFEDLNLDVCLEIHDESLATYNLTKVQELLLLRCAEIIKARGLENPQEIAVVNSQIGDLIGFYAIDNEVKLIRASRLRLLQSWVQLTLLMIQAGEFDTTNKTSIVLQTLQTTLPWLDNNLENGAEVVELAKLVKSLLFALEFNSESFKQGDLGDLVSDRLFYLFQVSLRAVTSIGANPTLKEYFYSIGYRYLTGMSDVASISGIHRRHSTQTIKAAGDRFIDVVCDDAYGGEPMCRISALLFLSALVNLAKYENSKYVIESLARLNFIAILVDSIQTIPTDLRETSREDIELQLSYFHARLVVILHISQTRFGATAVLNAGLFHSILVSGLFVTDPDLGVDIDAPVAINKHFDLLAAVMRVICAAVLSRGAQNEQTLEQGRKFLTGNRLSIMAVFKKSAGLGGGSEVSEDSVNELAESYMLLMSITGFLDVEEQTDQKRQPLKAFT